MKTVDSKTIKSIEFSLMYFSVNIISRIPLLIFVAVFGVNRPAHKLQKNNLPFF